MTKPTAPPKTFETLITADELRTLVASGAEAVVLDCGFDLADPDHGEHAYEARHIAGALYAHLDRDLCGAKTGRNGRHPLPAKEDFAARVGAWGIGPATQVVTYDDQGGVYAARTWWMLRWLGHERVAVLDGGLAAWRAAGGAIDARPPALRPQAAYAPRGTMPTVETADVLAALGTGAHQIVDARAGERFRGEVEPLDPVPGHIPGAIHRFFKDNLGTDGRFKPAAVLRAEYARFEGVAPATVVHQCGSGVTACHNLLAMKHAGFADTALYPGSWSEWCAEAARPVARGA